MIFKHVRVIIRQYMCRVANLIVQMSTNSGTSCVLVIPEMGLDFVILLYRRLNTIFHWIQELVLGCGPEMSNAINSILLDGRECRGFF